MAAGNITTKKDFSTSRLQERRKRLGNTLQKPASSEWPATDKRQEMNVKKIDWPRVEPQVMNRKQARGGEWKSVHQIDC